MAEHIILGVGTAFCSGKNDIVEITVEENGRKTCQACGGTFYAGVSSE